MKHYVRYIAKELTYIFLLITSILTLIIWLSQSFRYNFLITTSKIDLGTFLSISALLVPSLLYIILPISSFIAVVYYYNKLLVDSELVILENAGLSRMELAKPVLIVALFVVIISYFLSLYLLPYSYREFKDRLTSYRDNYSYTLLEEGVFNSSIKGITIYIGEKTQDGMIHNILIHDYRNPTNPITIMAEKGKIIKLKNSTKFDLINGNRQEINENNHLAILYFEHFSYYPRIEKNKSLVRVREAQERYLHELLQPNQNIKNPHKLKSEFHQRLIWPMYNLAMSLLGLVAILPNEFNRKGLSKRIAIFSVLAISILMAFLIINNIGYNFDLLKYLPYIMIVTIIMVEIKALRN